MTEEHTPSGENPESNVRLLSYNVLYKGVVEGLYPEIDTEPYAWEERRDSVAETVKVQGPDVVAFQEVWMDQFDDLDERLPGYAWVARDDGMKHTPIAYRSDRFEVVESGTFWLSEDDAEPGEAGWDGAHQRLVTHATLREGDAEFAVFSVHLDHVGERAREEGARVVREKVTEFVDAETPVAVAGDFNCGPGSDAYERMVERNDAWRGLEDASETAEAVDGPEITFTGLHEDDSEEEQNLDHIFVSGFEVARQATVVPEDESIDFRPSDHRPIVADLLY
ncbi:MAG: endonuclease/exonuclease/phosphatase family protein [Halobacteriales archaeon]|nr:endonuclease/exonuclease/phosphatase family protein [Halobacteriales archaeon]